MGLTIAVIAPGAMGSAIGRRLQENGARVLTSLSARSAATIARAKAANMADATDDAIAAEADFVLSVVPPASAVALAERLQGSFSRARRTPVYIDFNAVAPETVTAVCSASGLADDVFVDGAIIGAPPKPGQKGPAFYVSGTSAERVKDLNAFGLDIRVMDGPVGAASTLKMCYAGITKGFTAIGATMVLAAARAGASEALVAELEASQPAMLARLRTALPDMLPKAYRWVAEMEEIAGFIGEDHGEHLIYRGAAKLYDRLSSPDDRERAALTTL